MGSPIHSFPEISDLQHILPKSPQSLLKGVQGSTQIFKTPSPAPPPWDLLTSAVEGGTKYPEVWLFNTLFRSWLLWQGVLLTTSVLGSSVREAAPLTRTSQAELSTTWAKHSAFPASSQQPGELGHVRSTAETSGSSSVQGGSWGCASSPCNLKFHTQLGSASLGFSPCYVTYRWQNKPGHGLLLGANHP